MSTAKTAQPAQAKPRGDQPDSSSAESGRSLAEWVSLGVSLAIVIAMAGLVVYAHLTRSNVPAVIAIQPQLTAVRVENGVYYLPVEVTNSGGQTVEALSVELTLTGPGEPETAQVTVPFLADGATVRAVAAFAHDPAAGELEVSFSYLEP